MGFQNGAFAAVFASVDLCYVAVHWRYQAGQPLHLNITHSRATVCNMGVWSLARRALTAAHCLDACTGKFTGRYPRVTFLSRASAPTGTCVKKYCEDSRDGPAQFVCYHLSHRTLLKIQGQDTSPFLQGIITNDMELLQHEPGLRAMYSHMLNVQGRTLYDIMLYRYNTSLYCFIA